MEWPSTWTDRRDRDRTPSIPGHELVGVVTALGYGTTGLSVGQRVFGLADWHRDGTLAEYVAIEARNLAPLPGDVDFTVGASLPISALTAWQGLFQHGRLQAGLSVLAHGAAGAVGSNHVLGEVAHLLVLGLRNTSLAALMSIRSACRRSARRWVWRPRLPASTDIGINARTATGSGYAHLILRSTLAGTSFSTHDCTQSSGGFRSSLSPTMPSAPSLLSSPMEAKCLPSPREPDTEAPSRLVPEVHSALRLAVDPRRHTNPLPWRRASGMESITTMHF